MELSKVLDSISSFLIDPHKSSHSKPVKALAWATTIILGIGTLGIAQGASALWRAKRNVQRNDTHSVIRAKFQELFPNRPTQAIHRAQERPVISESNPPISKPTEAMPMEWSTTLEDKIIGNKNILNTFQEEVEIKTSITSIAENIYNNRLELFLAAKHETPEPKSFAAIQTNLIRKICQKFEKEGFSLSEIGEDQETLNLFLSSSVLKPALVEYAKLNGLQNILDQHLQLLATKVFNERSYLSAKAAEMGENDPHQTVFALLSLIRITFQEEGRSLREVLQNQEALDIFQESGRLNLILILYVDILKKKATNAPNDVDRLRKQAAIEQGKKDGAQKGFVTQLGMNAFTDNEALLDRELKKLLLRIHPDKNPDADLDEVKAANVLRGMIARGDYKDYRQAIEEERRNRQ